MLNLYYQISTSVQNIAMVLLLTVDADNPFHDHVLEDVVHHCLGGGRAVHEAKEHDLWFKESMVCAEGSFPFISIADPHVVEAPVDI